MSKTKVRGHERTVDYEHERVNGYVRDYRA